MKTSKQIEIWRDVMAHYAGQPERQEELFRELMREIRRAVMPYMKNSFCRTEITENTEMSPSAK